MILELGVGICTASTLNSDLFPGAEMDITFFLRTPVIGGSEKQDRDISFTCTGTYIYKIRNHWRNIVQIEANDF